MGHNVTKFENMNYPIDDSEPGSYGEDLIRYTENFSLVGHKVPAVRGLGTSALQEHSQIPIKYVILRLNFY